MILGIRWRSLRAKIIAWSFFPAMLILSILAAAAVYGNEQTTRELTITSSREFTRLAAAQFESQLRDFLGVLEAATRLPDIQSGAAILQQTALGKVSDQLAVFDGGVVILNIYGKVAAVAPISEQPAAKGQPAANYPLGQDWSAENFYKEIVHLPNPVFSEMTDAGRKYVVLALPITGSKGQLVGVIAGRFRIGSDSASAFYGAIARLRISEGKTAFLINEQGKVLYHTDLNLVGQDFSQRPSVRSILPGQAGAVRGTSENGQPILTAFAPVPDTRWELVIEQNWLELLAPRRGYGYALLALLVLGLVIPMAVLAVGVGKITRPVKALTGAVSSVADGHLDTTINITTGDEVEELGKAFNKMSRQLEKLYDTERRANRSLRALSACNQALIRATDEAGLLQEICRIIVIQDDYRMAWVGYCAGDGSRQVRPIAQAGYEDGYLALADIRYDESERGRGPTGMAIRTGKPAVIQDIFAAPEFAPWQGEASKRGFKGVISLPLHMTDHTLGALTIYSAEANAFDKDEIRLLTEFSEDLTYGITALRAQAELARHRDHLEDLVAERTLELDQLNRDLLRAKEQAEEADRLKSAFLATMSHELRTPLNSILGFTGVLLQGLAGPLNPEQAKQMGFVQTSARHLLELINDVLDISKIEAGQLNLAPAVFELDPAIEKVVQLVSPLARKKNLPLLVTKTDGPVRIFQDQRRFEQVLINLVNNAIKFTESGQVEIHCQEVGSTLSVAVSDSGIGMQPDQMQKIFRPFSQIDTGLTRKYEGTGLGLSISKKLVEMMGGSLQVESQWGAGSTFTVLLPIRYGEAL